MKLLALVSVAVFASPFALAGPLGILAYGVCQAGCASVVVACYSAAGVAFGTMLAAAAPPAIVACNAGQGACYAACAAIALAPAP